MEYGRNLEASRGEPFLKNYIKANIALVLKFLIVSEGFSPQARLRKRAKPIPDTAFIVFQRQIASGDLKQRNQEMVLVSDVHSMNSPNSFIPSIVRLYVGDDEVVEARTGILYSFTRVSRP
jgi:hypothetical protein